MFIAVWMIYAADRLLDARSLDTCTLCHGLEERHRFHHAHRGGFLAAIGVASLTLLYLLHRLEVRAMVLYVLLATLLGVWMLIIHARAQADQRLPKEIAVALFFPAAVFIPTVARNPALRLTLLPVAVLFAGVCALNCLLLYAWEHPADRTTAHATTRWATQHLGAVAIALIVGAAIEAALHHTRPALACGLSVLLLCCLHRTRNRMSAIHLRAAADLALLTPLLWLAR
jgi:hypothetical protein